MPLLALDCPSQPGTPGRRARYVDVSTPPDLPGASDQEVVALARQGREEGYRELLRRYQRPVFTLIDGWLAAASWPKT